MTAKQKILVILGPTASGKTALAEFLASVFRGEIISADSRQVYREMNIGTAKTAARLIDIKNPDEMFSSGQYKELAIKTIGEAAKRKKLPILVGGTGLYIKTIVENLEIPAISVQHDLRARLEEKSVEELFSKLEQLDPIGAQRIDRYNKRRLVRALEVTVESGAFKKTKGEKLFDVLQIGVFIERETLFARIEKRVDGMLAQGLEKEVRALVKKYSWTKVLSTTIGYKEWKGFFEGSVTSKDVKKEIINHTRQYVKKQLTWFRADKTIHWIQTKNEAHRLVKKFLDDSAGFIEDDVASTFSAFEGRFAP